MEQFSNSLLRSQGEDAVGKEGHDHAPIVAIPICKESAPLTQGVVGGSPFAVSAAGIR